MAENFYGVTNTGRMRSNNEDTFFAEQLFNGWIAVCVIDGVGGYEGGEVAAEIARETIREKLVDFSPDTLQTLRESLLQANSNIYNEKLNSPGRDQMACVLTLAVVDLENNQFHYAHVGDTRLYLLRDQSLVKVTKDHSFVGFLEDSGRLSEKEAMAHPKRNEINKALGFDPQIDIKTDYIETGSSPFLPGDMLLLCSDGLSDLVNRNEMTAVLLSQKSLQQKGEALIDAANVAGGKDNITVVLVQNSKKPMKLKATKPVLIKKNKSDETVTVEPKKPVSVKTEKSRPAQAKKGFAAVWTLAGLSFVLLVACLYLWLQRNNTNDPSTEATAAYTPNEAEKQLTDSLYLSDRFFSFAGAGAANTINLGDTVFLRQDTLHFNGNGLVLQSDSAFRGPALFATTNNKMLLLENITFSGFSTAIVLQGRALQLRNVRFQNCGIPVQHYLHLPADSTLNGTIRDTFLFTVNPLPK